VESSPLGPNTTFAVLPNARHQVRNTGSEDLQAIITIDNLPFRVSGWHGLCSSSQRM
jgi:mannose-6-phosphate isomerase-like protein (cupin superfamily)